MRRWLKARVGQTVHICQSDAGCITLQLTRVGLWTVEGVDEDGDENVIPIRSIRRAYRGTNTDAIRQELRAAKEKMVARHREELEGGRARPAFSPEEAEAFLRGESEKVP